MLGLVETDFAGSRHLELRHETEPFVLDRPHELDALLLELGDGPTDVVAHEEQLVLPGPTAPTRARVNTELARRERKDQPAGVGLHVLETEHVAEERAGRICILGEDERVDPGDHGDIIATTASVESFEDKMGPTR